MHSSVVTSANSKKVKIYSVGLGTSTSYFENYLKPLANNTAGAFYLSSDASKLDDVYENINIKLILKLIVAFIMKKKYIGKQDLLM